MLVIGLTGMPGAGKTEFVKLAQKRGFAVYRMGDAVWEWVKNRGLELTNDTVARMANEERKKYGGGIWAERTIEMIKKKAGKIIIDGIRSPDEIKIFKNYFHNFVLVAVHAPPEIRFKRIVGRERVDDAKSKNDFLARDKRELGWGIGEVIRSADFLLVNDCSLSDFRLEVEKLLNLNLHFA
ncbi:MAG: AAA family ATPase [Candidatus Thermoplasmatota archaeon]|nr:AAA family ATPase [Candidatus Thermoplasmatota archaeon]